MILPDEPDRMRPQILRWQADPQIHAILVTGGTGISPRDQTFETVSALLTKPLPGYGELFRMLSFALPFLTAMFVANTCLRGAGDTLTPAVTFIIVDIVNVIFSWGLTYGLWHMPAWGFDGIAAGLREFRGAERRFELRGEANGILIVDDYGHHPTEIAAVLAAARTLGRRIVVAFQPHRYSRTAALLDAFGPALASADHVVLTDIYAAGEDPIAGATLDALAASVRRTIAAPVEVAPTLDELVAAVVRAARPGDVVITLGAGSIGSVPERLVEKLGGRDPGRGGGPATAKSSGAPAGGETP